MTNNKGDLGYLGVPFQFRLAHHFMDDKKFFRDMCDIVDPNMFTDVNIRRFVGTLKNFYEQHEYVPSYDDIEIELRSKTNGNEIEVETVVELVKKIKNTSCEGHDSIKSKAHKFFKQQNLTKAWNKVGEILKIGDIDRYDECEDIIRNALVSGNRDEIGIKLRDNLGEVLSEDYRNVIPTGIKGVDEALEGGLGRGELAVLIGPSSFGKEQPISEIICTPNGFVKMGDIQIGDFVINEFGKPVEVTGTFPQGIKDVYRVTFSDNVSVECGIDHLWNVNTLYQRCGKKYVLGRGYKGKKDYIKDESFVTMSLRDIIEKGLYRKRGLKKVYNFKVPMPNPVEFNSIPVTIPPYLMGYMIGDGCFSRTVITVGESDIEEVTKLLSNEIDITSSIRHERENITHSLYLGYEFKNDLLKYYPNNTKSEDKYIHKDYLYNSIENRIAILNGLMDSDGTCQKNGCSCFNTKSKQLAEDVKTLVLSLGGFAIVRDKKASYYNKKYEKQVDCGIHYEVTITLCNPSIPIFRLKRKQDRVVYRTKRKDNRFIKGIELVRREESKCIMVDSVSGLYLTRDFIVTHNTSMTTAIANHSASLGYKTLQIVFEDKEKQIQRKHIAKITNIESRNLSKPENIELAREIMAETSQFDDNLIIKKFNTGEITPINLRNYIKRLTNTGFKPELIVVDYFECLTSSKNFKDQWTGEGHTMRALEALASDLDVALWVPTQGTKDSLNADIVTMDKAGGSFKKIQIAHIVISIARSMEDIENNIATIAVLKNRSGRSGAVMEGIYFNNGTCDVNTDNVQIYNNWSEYETVKGERKTEKNINILEEARKRREEAKRKLEENNNK